MEYHCCYPNCQAVTERNRAVVLVDNKATEPTLKTRAYCSKLHAAMMVIEDMREFGQNTIEERCTLEVAMGGLRRLAELRGIVP